MRIFVVTAAAAGLLLSVAVSNAHEPEWVSDLKDDGGPPAWVEDLKTDGGPPAFVGDDGGLAEDAVVADDVAANEETSEASLDGENANVPEWVADVKADGGPPAWVEDVKAEGGPPSWVADVRTTPAAGPAAIEAREKRAGR